MNGDQSRGFRSRLGKWASRAQRLLEPASNRRRDALRAKPLAPQTRDRVLRHSTHYRSCPPHIRTEFDGQLQVFLDQKRVTPIETRLTGEARLLVAVSAVTLTAGWPGYTWDQLSEVLLYPEHFDRDYQFSQADAGGGEPALDTEPILSGQAHPWGVVILSHPALTQAFTAAGRSVSHVGFHEFAHLLDLSRSRFDGVPSYLGDDAERRWIGLLEREHERLARGDSVLDPYGLSSPPELFAVAVEAFFQYPEGVARAHGDLYEFLASYFNQDPARWRAELQQHV